MKIVCTLNSLLAVILNSSVSGSGSQSQSPDELTASSRSRSSTLRQTFPGVLGFRFEDLSFIRLRPHNHPNRVFELRTYVFPPDKPIGLRTRNFILNPIPTGEKIVLSTSGGDAYAILDKSPSKTTILRAICTLVSGRTERAKMNMNSGVVEALTAEEIKECPVTVKDAIANSYEVSRSDSQCEDPTYSNYNPSVERYGPLSSSLSSARSPPPSYSFLRDRLRSPTLRQTFPTVFGYPFDDLEFIRLIPARYPHRIFELRKYTLPQEKPIGLMTKNHVLNPVPTGDQIVLSTSNGEVCAILEKSQCRHIVVRPIFSSILGVLKRVKLDMNSGAVEVMTSVEIAECPGMATGLTRKHYRAVRLK